MRRREQGRGISCPNTHLLPDGREGIGERDHVFVLAAFPNLAKARVIAVLLAPLGVTAGGLCPSANGHIQTSVQAGGIASALMRSSTSNSASLDPSTRL